MTANPHMNGDLLKLQQIIAKTFRKAKRWYAGYLLCQLLVLAFAVVSIFAQVNPNLSALIAFLGVLATECVRWRSDAWKSEAESAKRKWEVADGLGAAVDGSYIADWLAAKNRKVFSAMSALSRFKARHVTALGQSARVSPLRSRLNPAGERG